MLVPIEASTRLLPHSEFTTSALDEAVTAFNAELADAFAAAGQVLGIPASGIANVIKVDTSMAGGPLAAVSASVTLAVLTDDAEQVDALAAGFRSSRFPDTTLRVTGSARMAHLRGLGQFTETQTSAQINAGARITGIANAT